jgi:hypothetical protein
VTDGPNVILPNEETISTTEKGTVSFHPSLSKEASLAHVLPKLTNSSLVSLGKLCDDDCLILLHKKWLSIMKNNEQIMKGTRNQIDGLWDIDIEKKVSLLPGERTSNNTSSEQPKLCVNMIIRKDRTKQELGAYLHDCAFSPCLSTFQQAIRNGNYLSWPGIENINFKNIIRDTTAIEKGHMDQERKNLQTTKPAPNIQADYFPTDGIGQKTYEYASVVLPLDPKLKTYLDLTGRFPHRSSRGNEYIYVLYDFDANAILAKAIPNRQAKTLVNAWEELHAQISQHGHPTKHFVLDNEISAEFRTALTKYSKTFELTPANIHRRNAAERAIRTYKNHLLAGLATCDPDFPINEWDRLIPQSVLTLNLLRNSRVNPKLSSYAYLFGNFDFNQTPLAPLGTKAVVHKKASVRDSWAYHGVEGWTIGPSTEHYRCIKCFMPETRAEIDPDTIKLIQCKIPIPTFTDKEVIAQAILDIVHLLQKPSNHNIPAFMKGDK